MNATQLLEHFDRLAEAPGAVPRLRRFILDLAVRGKLVEPDADDEPATVLINQIEAEKGRLVRAGIAGKQEAFEPILDVDTPFPIPNAWTWVPATFPAYMVSDLGKKVQTKDVLPSGEFPVVDQGKVFIRGYCNDQDKVIRVVAPLILFGDHTRETKLIDFDFVVGADGVKLLQPVCLFTRYYFLALQWLPLDSRGYGRHFKLLKSACIPIPPLAEQHRIVAKVDELMALCDQLEAAQQERERRRDLLAAASLQRLNQPATDTTPEAQREYARFHLHHLPRLTTRPEHIKAMRQTFLNLAVSGRLVPQDAGDESARALLDRIAASVSSTATAKAGSKSHKQKPSAVIAPPYLVPVNWQWAHFSEVASVRSNLVDPKDYQKMPHIAPDNIESRTGRLRPYETVATSGMFSAKHHFFGGCILYSKIRPALAKAVIVDFDGLCSADMYPIFPLIDCAYLHKYMLTDTFVIQTLKEDTRVAMPKINQAALSVVAVPIPPAAEQHRIVAKVDELMALCDQLEAQLNTTQTDSRRLLEAVLQAALSPA